MGNRFGKFETEQDAVIELINAGFARKEDDLGVRFVKPSINAFGQPMTAIVKIIEQRVDPVYGQPNYFQYEYI